MVRARVQGPLKLSVPVAFSALHVLPHLGSFLKQHPRLQLDLIATDRYVDVVAEGVMLALRIGRLDDSGLLARKLLRNRRILVAAPGYLQARGVPTLPADLELHNCLQLSLNRDGEVWRLHNPDSVKSLRPAGNVRADSGEAIRRLALDAVGIAFLSEVNVAPALLAVELVQVLAEWSGPDTASAQPDRWPPAPRPCWLICTHAGPPVVCQSAADPLLAELGAQGGMGHPESLPLLMQSQQAPRTHTRESSNRDHQSTNRRRGLIHL